MNETHTARVRRILNKLANVRRRGVHCFGSDSHKFKLAEPITETEVRAFEAAHRVKLPDDFRAFLLSAGNGGAGPSYGIFPLKEWRNFDTHVLENVPADFVDRPCALQPGRNVVSTDSAEDTLAAYQGTMLIGTRGCSDETLLIVSGPYRGRIVLANSEFPQEPYVVRDHDFLAWYERWLDELLAGFNVDSFGFGPGGGEAEYVRIVNDPRTDDDLLGETAWAFCRLPAVSEEGGATIVSLLSHRLENVRAAALYCVGQFTLAGGKERAVSLLSDPSAEVRRRALQALIGLDPRDAGGHIRKVMLAGDADGVGGFALFLLENNKALARADLLYLMQTAGHLHASAARAHAWMPEDVDLATRLLDDPDGQARMLAVIALRKLGARSSAPALASLLDRESASNVIDHALEAIGELGDRAAGDTLLKWTEGEEDSYRLRAVLSLIKLGDVRVLDRARAMLTEDREPMQRGPLGILVPSHIHTIRDQVRWALADSPEAALRALTGVEETKPHTFLYERMRRFLRLLFRAGTG